MAEIGINHNGSLIIAKDLIAQSKAAGFDAVKFQKGLSTLSTEEILNSYRVSPWGETTREQKQGLELSLEEYEEIDKYCKMLDIDWFVSYQSQKG